MAYIRRGFLEGVQRVLLAALVVISLAIVSLGIHLFWTWRQPAGTTPETTLPAVEQTDGPVSTAGPTTTGSLTETPTRSLPGGGTASAQAIKIGIVAGHWEHDPGAVCDDGLKEVDINLSIAQQVVSLLSLAGYDAEILAEFSPKLDGYQATALISIHADSCHVPDVSGFKVAHVSSSLVPELEDRLVTCLIDRYRAATGLRFHKNSITYDMTEYHAFYEIAPETPAAIIEIGFLGADRRLLTKQQDRVTHGIVNGIKCFVTSTR